MSYLMMIEKDDTPNGEFSVNIWGMKNLRELMKQVGMLVDELPYDDWRDKPLDYHGKKPGIEMFKFCTNDGWLVTEKECTEALHIYSLSGTKLSFEEPHQETRWYEWLAFMRRASQRGGFRVH